MFRVLFVDDDPQILNGLRRMLSGLDGGWRMDFVGSGAEALRLMESSPVDVLVSDIRMPEMNGPRLLRAVRELHPAIARIILSGFADEVLIQDTIGVAHQFLSKPCDAEVIERALRSLAAAQRLLPVVELRRLAGDGACLASARPACSRSCTGEHAVAAMMRTDIAMAARTLHLVNSAFFGLRRCVGDPAHAVRLLGIDRLHAVASSLRPSPSDHDGATPGLDRLDLARHTHRVAALARAIVEAEGGSHAMAEQAALAGRLHDVGRLMLASAFPERYRAIGPCSSTVDREAAERAEFGADHAQVGSYLAALWGFEDEVVHAIACHHRHVEQAEVGCSVLTALSAADALVGEATDRPGAVHGDVRLSTSCSGDRASGWRSLQAALASADGWEE